MITQPEWPFDVDAIESTYELGKLQKAKLLRAYTNDVYELCFEDERYVLKVYGAGWRTMDEVEWELDLLTHLSQQGVPLANALKNRSDRKLGEIVINGKTRPFVLFEYAEGAKPEPPFSREHYKRFGNACAGMHLAAQSFQSEHRKPDLDLRYLIDKPLAVAKPYLKDEEWSFIVGLGNQIKSAIRSFGADLDWGVCHGDMTQDNVHITENHRFVFYVFDSSAFGWRSLDFQGMYHYQQQAKNAV